MSEGGKGGMMIESTHFNVVRESERVSENEFCVSPSFLACSLASHSRLESVSKREMQKKMHPTSFLVLQFLP